jgi:hypothetical protein
MNGNDKYSVTSSNVNLTQTVSSIGNRIPANARENMELDVQMLVL